MWGPVRPATQHGAIMASRGARIRCWPSETLAAPKPCGTGGDLGRARARAGLSNACPVPAMIIGSPHRTTPAASAFRGGCARIPTDAACSGRTSGSNAKVSRRIVGGPGAQWRHTALSGHTRGQRQSPSRSAPNSTTGSSINISTRRNPAPATGPQHRRSSSPDSCAQRAGNTCAGRVSWTV